MLGFDQSFADDLAQPRALWIIRESLQLSDILWEFVDKGRDLLAEDRSGYRHHAGDTKIEKADYAEGGNSPVHPNPLEFV